MVSMAESVSVAMLVVAVLGYEEMLEIVASGNCGTQRRTGFTSNFTKEEIGLGFALGSGGSEGCVCRPISEDLASELGNNSCLGLLALRSSRGCASSSKSRFVASVPFGGAQLGLRSWLASCGLALKLGSCARVSILDDRD